MVVIGEISSQTFGKLLEEVGPKWRIGSWAQRQSPADEFRDIIQVGKIGDFALDQTFHRFRNTDWNSFDGVVTEFYRSIFRVVVQQDTTSDGIQFHLKKKQIEKQIKISLTT